MKSICKECGEVYPQMQTSCACGSLDMEWVYEPESTQDTPPKQFYVRLKGLKGFALRFVRNHWGLVYEIQPLDLSTPFSTEVEATRVALKHEVKNFEIFPVELIPA